MWARTNDRDYERDTMSAMLAQVIAKAREKALGASETQRAWQDMRVRCRGGQGTAFSAPGSIPLRRQQSALSDRPVHLRIRRARHRHDRPRRRPRLRFVDCEAAGSLNHGEARSRLRAPPACRWWSTYVARNTKDIVAPALDERSAPLDARNRRQRVESRS